MKNRMLWSVALGSWSLFMLGFLHTFGLASAEMAGGGFGLVVAFVWWLVQAK